MSTASQRWSCATATSAGCASSASSAISSTCARTSVAAFPPPAASCTGRRRTRLYLYGSAGGVMMDVMAMEPMAELAALRQLARAIAGSDPDADDLLQEAAVTLLVHPPACDRPV